jgi:CTP:molybdopterin cytidylyltransferase MocA
MLSWIVDLYRDYVDGIAVVAHPSARHQIAAVLGATGVPGIVTEQAEPTGMLDAVVLGCGAAAGWSPDRLWVTWCDQVAVHPATVARLARVEPASAMTLPLISRTHPYIHFDRDAAGRITAVRQRREGDAMPDQGDSDMGLFSLSAEAAASDLALFAASAVPDRGTGERNFLPFIPWLAERKSVATIAATQDIEAVGVNTPDDLARVAAYLTSR